jgi:translocation and assembly module TamB
VVRRTHLVMTVAIVQSAVIIGLFFGTAWVLLGTKTGRGWVEQRVEAELRSRYRSGEGATLAGLSLLPIGTLSLDAIVLRDSAGTPVVSTGRVSVRVALQPLLDREVRVTHVQVERLRVELVEEADSTWNLEKLMRFSRDTTAKAVGGRPWRVQVDSVAFLDGEVAITRPDSLTGAPRRETVSAIDLHLGGATYDPATLRGGFNVRQLALTSTAPPVALRRMNGRIEVAGDTVALALGEVALDRTSASVRGVIVLPRGSEETQVSLVAPAERFDFGELGWLNELVPAEGGGRATVAVTNGPYPRWMTYAITGLEMESGTTRASGRVTAQFGPKESDVAIRDVNIAVAPLDFTLLREIFGDSVPPPPFDGALRGRIVARGGPLDAFVLDSAALEFEDRRAGGARSRFVAAGTVDITGEEAVLAPMVVRIDSLPIVTAGAIVAIADSLRGYLTGSVRLAGPMDNVRFTELDLWHSDGALPRSHIRGNGRISDDESTTWLETVLTIDQLSVAAFGHPFTSESLAGTVAGTLEARATGDSVWMDLALRGEGAEMEFVGATTLDTLRLVAKGDLRLRDFDGRRFLPEAGLPAHRLTAVATLGIDGPWEAPSGPVEALIDPSSTLGDVAFGSARADVVLEPGGIRVDTLQLDGPLGRLSARGRLSRDASLRDTLRFVARVDSLVQLRGFLPDSLARAWADSLGGRIDATGIAVGSFDTLDVRAELTGERMRAGSHSVERITADLLLDGLPSATRGLATFRADSMIVAGLPITRLEGEATVREPAWADASMRLVAGDTLRANLRADIHLMGDSLAIRLDSLNASTRDGTWALDTAAAMFSGPDRFTIDGLDVRSSDGGRFTMDAHMLSGGSIELRAQAIRVPMSHARFTGLIPPRFAGDVSFDVTLTGTEAAPLLTFTAALDTLRVDDRPVPAVRMDGRYADRLATFNVHTLFDGRDAMRITAELPVDLALDDRALASRLIEAPLYVRFSADAAPLSSFAPFTTTVRDLEGGFVADLQVTGTWKALEPRGFVVVRDGAFTAPALGTGFEDLLLDLSLSPDSIFIHRFRLSGERAASDSAFVEGAVVRNAAGWQADLRTVARNLRIIDDPRVAEADVAWSLRLHGPLDSMRLSGDVSMPTGNIFIGRQQRRVLALEDDTVEELDAMRYAPRIDALRVRLGNEVRLRSPEASVQLTGTVDVTGKLDAPDVRGEILATRGTYRLDLGLLQRTFQVDSGRVRVNGPLSEPATLDIHTSYTVRQAERDDVQIRARLTGTVDQPRLQLSSGDLGTTASDTEIISYLLFGAPSFALDGQSSSAVRLATAALVPSLGGAAERALGARIPFLSELQVTTVAGDAPRDFRLNSFEGLLNSFALTAGTQIGPDSYLRVSGGVCRGENDAAQTLPAWMGISAEYRPRERVSAELSLTPGNAPCNRIGTWTQIYQFGLDIFRDWRW